MHAPDVLNPSPVEHELNAKCPPPDVSSPFSGAALRVGVLVKNQYSGINFIDTYHRSGLYKRELPFIGGQEGGGVVAAVTPEAEAQGVKVSTSDCIISVSTPDDRIGLTLTLDSQMPTRCPCIRNHVGKSERLVLIISRGSVAPLSDTGARVKAWCFLMHAEASLSFSHPRLIHSILTCSKSPSSHHIQVGDRVAYSSVFQTYAEFTAVPANKVITVPEQIPLDVAVSCGVQGMTAGRCSLTVSKPVLKAPMVSAPKP